MPLRPRLAVGCALALTLSLVGLAAAPTWAAPGSPTVAATAGDFYTPPTSLAGTRPGDVVKQQPTSILPAAASALPVPATAQRLMYVSTGVRGERVAVTGTLLTPTTAWTGPGERPLVTYAVGTQGMGDQCAPSRQFSTGSEYETPFISALLARGYTVVVSDYQGLGTPGAHAYTLSTPLGHDVLDAARAAKRVATGAVPATAPVFVYGYSEGGNAAAAALEQQPTYAPGLHLVGGYAGAVPADLTKVATKIDGSLYAAFLLYSVKALDAYYPALHIADLLTTKGRAAVAAANKTCTSDGIAPAAFVKSSSYTRSGKPVMASLSRPDIAAVLAGLKLGGRAPTVPVLVAHSTGDDVVPYDQDLAMVRSWCAEGADVTFAPGVAPSHVAGAAEGAPKALAFFEEIIEGQTPVSTCDLPPVSGLG